MITAIAVCTAAGKVYFLRHFREESDDEERRRLELSMLKAVEAAGAGDEGHSAIVEADGEPVVARKSGELVAVAAGCEEDDELSLESLLALVVALLADSFGKSTALAMHNTNGYGKFVTALDEVVHRGLLLETDLDTVLRSAKFKDG